MFKKILSSFIVFNFIFCPGCFALECSKQEQLTDDSYFCQYKDKNGAIVFGDEVHDFKDINSNLKIRKIKRLPLDNNKGNTYNNSIFLISPRSAGQSPFTSDAYCDYYSMIAFIPSLNSSEFLNNIFKTNNDNSFLKFNNYNFKEGTLVIKNKDKYGFIVAKDNIYYLIYPQFDDFYLPDMNTFYFRQFGVSKETLHFLVKKNWVWHGLRPQLGDFNLWDEFSNLLVNVPAIDYIESVRENVAFANNNINFTFKNVSGSDDNEIFATAYKINTLGRKKLNKTIPDKISDLYKLPEKEYKVSLSNFPQKAMLIREKKNKKGIIFYDDKKIKSIPFEYDDFRFFDMNTIAYQLLNASYSPWDKIFAKKNGKWGIIDSDNNIIVDFKYDNIHIPFVRENTVSTHVSLDYYKGYIFPSYDYILVQEGDKTGAINSKGNILIPLQETVKDNYLKDFNEVKNYYNDEIKNQNNKDKLRNFNPIDHVTGMVATLGAAVAVLAAIPLAIALIMYLDREFPR